MPSDNMPEAVLPTSMKLDNAKTKSTKSNRKSTNSNECNICHKSNMTLSGLKIHLLTHTGEKPYHCTVCDKRFTCSSNLKKHQRIHNKDYIYTCEVCGKTCSDPSNMKKHMTVHSGKKAYVCPSCGKSYSYAQSLRQHMDDVHVGNGEKRLKNKRKGQFPCPECGKVFGYYWRCSLHEARIHAVERPFKCPECGKCFARETILGKHMQTHQKPHSCNECDRRFSFRDQLKKHQRTHNGEKPYQCETCLKSFSQRGSLTEHMRTHTGIKPYTCAVCGVKFTSSSSLRRHERKVKSCFPAPEGEKIPVVTMYTPSSTIDIPRVETRPVIEPNEEMTSYHSYGGYTHLRQYSRDEEYYSETINVVDNTTTVLRESRDTEWLQYNRSNVEFESHAWSAADTNERSGNTLRESYRMEEYSRVLIKESTQDMNNSLLGNHNPWIQHNSDDIENSQFGNSRTNTYSMYTVDSKESEDSSLSTGYHGNPPYSNIDVMSDNEDAEETGEEWPISMVVRCDKYGKISVTPVQLSEVDGRRKIISVDSHEVDADTDVSSTTTTAAETSSEEMMNGVTRMYHKNRVPSFANHRSNHSRLHKINTSVANKATNMTEVDPNNNFTVSETSPPFSYLSLTE